MTDGSTTQGTTSDQSYPYTQQQQQQQTGNQQLPGQDNRLRQNQIETNPYNTLQNRNDRRALLLQLQKPPLTEFQTVIAESTGKVIPIFGADMFNELPSTFAPVDNIPVTPDYVIGPGDELRLQIWGQVNQRGVYVVDRTGSISLPQVGTVHVAGLRFTQLTDFLRSQLGRVYRNFDLNVNLGQLRSIQIFVVGKVRQPGSYTIGSLSTLLNALFVSGGPQPQGSLRDIQVRRNGETITHFDLYDLLLHGDKTKDVPLASGDVVFVPEAGPQIAVLGSVRTPAVYELHGEKNFSDVLALAGGKTNVAAESRVRVERVLKHAQRSVIEVDLGENSSPTVEDGDVVIVDSIVDRFKEAVTLRGNVANQGRYAWHSGMRIADLIPNQDVLVTRNYDQRQNVLGQLSTNFIAGPQTNQRTDTRQQLQQPVTNPMLTPMTPTTQSPTNDTLPPGVTGPYPETNTGRGLSGTSAGGNSVGAALTATSGTFAPKNDVVLSAPDIDWDYAVIERQNPENLTTTLVPFSLGKLVLEKDQTQNLELMSGDVVTIFSKADIRVPSAHQTKFVRLEGEFVAAGIYSVQPGETLRQLLARAGGFTPDAYLYASEFTRESVRRLQKQRLLEYADSLESSISTQTSAAISAALSDRDITAAQTSSAQAMNALTRLRQAQPSGRIVLQFKSDSRGVASVPDLELEDGDRFVVPKIPTSVSVVGQVYSANAFVFEPYQKVRDYLRLAGGPDRVADRSREFILRADGSVLSHQYASSRQFGDFNHIQILPGDTIVVPPKVEKGSVLRDTANIASILQGFGIAAAAVQVLK